jgi:hypothetical protein
MTRRLRFLAIFCPPLCGFKNPSVIAWIGLRFTGFRRRFAVALRTTTTTGAARRFVARRL